MRTPFKYLTPRSCAGLTATLGLVSSLAVAATPAQKAARPIAPTKTARDRAGAEAAFRGQIQPAFKTYCYPCHSGDTKMGNVAFDHLGSTAAMRQQNRALFGKVLKNLRSGTMPPPDMDQPTAAEKAAIEQWIKTSVYQIDPANPDPGRVTVRRLNRAEYHNTVRDLIGVDYDTQAAFPPDDAGHGFDNIGDVLTISPMLMEKYLNAAQTIVAQAVPTTPKVVAETEVLGENFLPEGGSAAPAASDGAVTHYRALSYYEPSTVSHTVQAAYPGAYQIVLDLSANEKYVDNQFDYNKCRLIVRADGEELFRKDLNREGGKPLQYRFDQKWQAGGHKLTFELQPLTPGVEQIRALTLRINKVTLRGPFDAKYMVAPRNYKTFFPQPVPTDGAARRVYARKLLGDFAFRAFRRPVDETTLVRLTALAENVTTQPGQTFEAGVAQAMTAVLASPRFLFREEGVASAREKTPFAPVDEYALASRLSYFLWSSMPDETLFRLAAQGQLRKNLPAQVQRMLQNPRSEALIQNFSGQWLQTRDIEKVPIDVRAVVQREIDPAAPVPPGGRRFGGRPRIQFDETRRKDLKQETEFYFGHVVRKDRSVLELIDSNYTFLNERLAQYYGLTDLGIKGDDFRQVTLPPGSPRGGVLTMGSTLAVTSNPTRTSPVKRGLFILDNILGAPAPPPPPNIPSLEASAEAGFKGHTPTTREVLAAHRAKPACSSCHNRLDPPGLALESFNAIGLWRTQEFGQPVTAEGTLVTGEPFKDVRGLKQILVRRHSTEFYRCLTEKLLTYALGRGLEDYDVEAVDGIVKRLQQNHGQFSTLLSGVINSAPFQKCRTLPAAPAAAKPKQVAFLSKHNAHAQR